MPRKEQAEYWRNGYFRNMKKAEVAMERGITENVTHYTEIANHCWNIAQFYAGVQGIPKSDGNVA